jgi:cobalt/nickel transport system permease protein
MDLIDQYAYSSRLRTLHPAQKAGLALIVIGLCLALNRPAVGVAALLWMGVLATAVAGTPLRVFGRILLAEGLFLTFSALGVAVSVGGTPPADTIATLSVGPMWFGVSHSGIASAITLTCRSLGAASALNMLILTTPLVDLIALAQWLRVPALLIDLMTLIYRSIFVLLESLQRMTTAQQSRLGYRTPARAMRSAGLLSARLFIDAYHRAQRLQFGLESRGYHGELRVLPLRYRHDSRWYAVMAAVIATLLAASRT